jgi:hypothetical protein
VILLDTVIFAVHLAKIGDQSKTILPGSNPLTNFLPGGSLARQKMLLHGSP